MTRKIAFIFFTVTLLSACGIKGSLDTAPPMWGKDRATYEAEKARKEAEEKAKAAEKAAQESPSTQPSRPQR